MAANNSRMSQLMIDTPVVSITQSRPLRTRRWLLLLALIPLALAGWQWQRAQLHRAQWAAFELAGQRPVQALDSLAWDALPQGQLLSLRVRRQGEPLRVANAQLAEQDGVRVWLPVALDDGSWVVLDRGWLPRTAAAGAAMVPLPDAPLRGRWLVRPQPFLLHGARLGMTGEVDALDWAALAAALPGRLRPGLLVLSPTVAPFHAWPVQPLFDPRRNDAYALQWLLLALCIALAAWRRDKHDAA